jgi:SpoVK/Ycf46/Vps4 family AAA+-type ATPase
MKSEFMSLWDGLTTSDKASITVLGATNRPFDIDLAILRRLPRTFLFDLPTTDERREIIQVQLTNQKQVISCPLLSALCNLSSAFCPLFFSSSALWPLLTPQLSTSPQDASFSFDKIAQQTVGYSGSDLKELCKFSR